MISNDKEEIKNEILRFYGNVEVIDEDGNVKWERDMNLPRLRNLYEYALDGVVIKPANSNKETQQLDKRIGRGGKVVVPHDPKDQIAVKLRSEVVSVKLVELVKKETKLGNVTVSGILDKPYKTESGAYVSNINLHNENWLELNSWITDAMEKGERLDMIMSLDIIPVLLPPTK